MVKDRPTLAHLYGSRTMLVLLALGFSGGIPNLLANSIAPAWTTVAGWSVEAIGLLALFQLPYALKFLWAPLVDRLRIPLLSSLGQRRSWLLASQIATLILIVATAAWGPGEWAESSSQHAWIFMALLAVTVFFSATQDIVGDAYRVEILPTTEMGAGAGIFVSGYRLSFVVLGAAILTAADSIGWNLAVALLGILALVGIAGTLVAREPLSLGTPEPGFHGAVISPISTLWRHWGVRLFALVAFVLVFRLPDQMANAMTAPLLLKGLGYTPAQLGWVRQGFGFTLTIAGALTGGWMVARFGLMKCLIAFGVLQALSNGGFFILADVFHATALSPRVIAAPIWALLPAIAIESFAAGLVSAGFVAFLMSVCEPRQVATQYAMLTALMALSGAISGALSGVLTASVDYPMFFLITILAGIPGMALIAFVRPPRTFQAHAV